MPLGEGAVTIERKMYTDSHAHLTGETLRGCLEPILERAQRSGVDSIVNICTDLESLEAGLVLHKQFPWVVNAAALTPHDVHRLGDVFFAKVCQMAQEGHLVAIGETGLDYYYPELDKGVQKEFLWRHFDLAKASSLPLIFHCREAFQDLFRYADEYSLTKPALIHCFTGTKKEAQEVIARGWYLSLSGILTFNKSEALREAVQGLPLDRLLIETDAPFLSPQKYRGKTNEPAFVIEVAAMLGGLYGRSQEEMGQITSENAHRFFGF